MIPRSFAAAQPGPAGQEYADLLALRQEVAILKQRLLMPEKRRPDMLASLSFRLTAPLRTAGDLLRRADLR